MSAAEKYEQLLNASLESLTLPDVYLRLRYVMDGEDSTMADAAEVLSLDPALAARVLRIANSAFYGFRAEVDTVSRAASILGLRKIHDLTLAASVAGAMGGLDNDLMDLNTFWYRSVHCGFLAEQIAAGAGARATESMFVRGLLHDIGHLVLFTHYPEECRKALAKSDQGMAARLAEERKLIGIDAMQFTAELARTWQLPASFVESYTHLFQPEEAEPRMAAEIAMLNIAVQISCGVDSDLLIEEVLARIDPKIWEAADLPPDVGAAVLDAAGLEMVDAMYHVLSHPEDIAA
jgi:HD-like signal output (HDOD) protein